MSKNLPNAISRATFLEHLHILSHYIFSNYHQVMYEPHIHTHIHTHTDTHTHTHTHTHRRTHSYIRTFRRPYTERSWSVNDKQNCQFGWRGKTPYANVSRKLAEQKSFFIHTHTHTHIRTYTTHITHTQCIKCVI